jgi:hypothetical protein
MSLTHFAALLGRGAGIGQFRTFSTPKNEHAQRRLFDSKVIVVEKAQALSETKLVGNLLCPFASVRKGMLLVILCLALASCSSGPVQTAEEISQESLAAIKRFVTQRNPRLVLRLTTAQPVVLRQGDLFVPSTFMSRETEGNLYLYSFAFQGGVIIALPVAAIGVAITRFAEAFSDSTSRSSIEHCKTAWQAFGKDGSDWANETFSGEPIAHVFEGELSRHFATLGRAHLVGPVTVEHAWTYPDFAAIEASFKETEPFLVLADVSHKLDWGLLMPGQSCGLQLTYEVQLYAVDMRPLSDHPSLATKIIVATRVSDPKTVQALLNDATLARQWVKDSLGAVAKKIADTYTAKGSQ